MPSEPSPTSIQHVRADLASYEQNIRLLYEASLVNDVHAMRRLMDALLIQRPEHETLLWTSLADGTTTPGFLLSVGVILGRSGGSQTLTRAVDECRRLAGAGTFGYDPKTGKPSADQAIFNALASNTLRHFLKRPDFREAALAAALESSFDSALSDTARTILLVTVAGEADGPLVAALASRFETADEVSRRVLVNAMCSTPVPDASVYLREWFTKYAEHRPAIAVGLARTLDAPVALELLRDMARDPTGRRDALYAIRTMGRNSDAHEFLVRAFLSEEDTDIRVELLHANARARGDANDRVVLASVVDRDARIRTEAYGLIPRVADGEVAFVGLSEALARETKPSARLGAVRGLLALTGPGRPRHASSVDLIRRELVASANSACVRDMADSLRRTAERQGWGPDGVALLREAAAAAPTLALREILLDVAR
jgi:hypothetical protein